MRHIPTYWAGVGSSPAIEAMAASSAEARKTLAPFPRRFGKLRVEVETTVVLSPTRAWLPMHREQPGISVRAPTYATIHRCEYKHGIDEHRMENYRTALAHTPWRRSRSNPRSSAWLRPSELAAQSTAESGARHPEAYATKDKLLNQTRKTKATLRRCVTGSYVVAFEQLSCRTKVPNVGHAGSNEHLVNLGSLDFREKAGIVWIVWCAEHWLLQL